MLPCRLKKRTGRSIFEKRSPPTGRAKSREENAPRLARNGNLHDSAVIAKVN
jgi:hypothetical protein